MHCMVIGQMKNCGVFNYKINLAVGDRNETLNQHKA